MILNCPIFGRRGLPDVPINTKTKDLLVQFLVIKTKTEVKPYSKKSKERSNATLTN